MQLLQEAVPSVKFRFVCATRETRDDFAIKTPLGRSLALHRSSLVELRLFPSNSTGLPKLYNIAIREAAADPAILLFVHDDVLLCDIFWPQNVFAGLQVFDIMGVAGNKRRLPNQPSWYFRDVDFQCDAQENLSGAIGHGEGFPPQDITLYGPPCQQVMLLDGVLLIANSPTLHMHGLRFDERFDFHFYDLDFCRQAELRNVRLGTWTISVVHQSRGMLGTPSWRAAYASYLQKWGS